MPPVIQNLLYTDLYKFTMWQTMLHRHPQTQAEYTFVCRNATAYPLAELEYYFGDAEPALVVCRPDAAAGVAPLAKRLGVRACVTLGTKGDGTLMDAAAAQRSGRSLDEIKAEGVAGIPAGRYGDAAEFGAMVAFLAGAASAYTTGGFFRVDGGSSKGAI